MYLSALTRRSRQSKSLEDCLTCTQRELQGKTSVRSTDGSTENPTVDVLVIHLNHVLSEFFDCVLSDAGFPNACWCVEEGWIRLFVVQDGSKDTGQVVDFSVAVFHLSGDELRLKHPCVGDHGVSTNSNRNKQKGGSFPNLPKRYIVTGQVIEEVL